MRSRGRTARLSVQPRGTPPSASQNPMQFLKVHPYRNEMVIMCIHFRLSKPAMNFAVVFDYHTPIRVHLTSKLHAHVWAFAIARRLCRIGRLRKTVQPTLEYTGHGFKLLLSSVTATSMKFIGPAVSRFGSKILDIRIKQHRSLKVPSLKPRDCHA